MDECLLRFIELINLRAQTECLDGFALLFYLRGKLEYAAYLPGAADASFERLGVARWSVDLLEFRKLRHNVEKQLGIDQFYLHYEQGHRMNLETVIEQQGSTR